MVIESIFLTKPIRTIITNFSHSLSNVRFYTFFLIKIENNCDKNLIINTFYFNGFVHRAVQRASDFA